MTKIGCQGVSENSSLAGTRARIELKGSPPNGRRTGLKVPFWRRELGRNESFDDGRCSTTGGEGKAIADCLESRLPVCPSGHANISQVQQIAPITKGVL